MQRVHDVARLREQRHHVLEVEHVAGVSERGHVNTADAEALVHLNVDHLLPGQVRAVDRLDRRARQSEALPRGCGAGARVTHPRERQPAERAEVDERAHIPQHPAQRRVPLEVARHRERDRAYDVVVALVVRRQRLLGRRLPVSGHLGDLPRRRPQVRERIGAGAARDLEVVDAVRAEPRPDAAIEGELEPAGVAEIGRREDVHVLHATHVGRIVVRFDPVGQVRHLVLVVRRDVEHQVRRERVTDAELELDGLVEPDVPPELVVRIREHQVVVRAREHGRQVRRLHLVRVGQPEVRLLGDRERHADRGSEGVVPHRRREHARQRGIIRGVVGPGSVAPRLERTRGAPRTDLVDGRRVPTATRHAQQLRIAEDPPRSIRKQRLGVEVVVADAELEHDVPQIEPVVGPARVADRVDDVRVHEDLGDKVGVPVRLVRLLDLAAEVEPVEPVRLPIDVGPRVPALLGGEGAAGVEAGRRPVAAQQPERVHPVGLGVEQLGAVEQRRAQAVIRPDVPHDLVGDREREVPEAREVQGRELEPHGGTAGGSLVRRVERPADAAVQRPARVHVQRQLALGRLEERVTQVRDDQPVPVVKAAVQCRIADRLARPVAALIAERVERQRGARAAAVGVRQLAVEGGLRAPVHREAASLAVEAEVLARVALTAELDEPRHRD